MLGFSFLAICAYRSSHYLMEFWKHLIYPPLFLMLSLQDMLNPVVSVSTPNTPLLSLPPSPENLRTEHLISINRQTRLDIVCHYPPNTLVEYPETTATATAAIGHVFSMDHTCWINPALNFAYSMGGYGSSLKNKAVKVSLLTDNSGTPVPCKEIHSTCK